MLKNPKLLVRWTGRKSYKNLKTQLCRDNLTDEEFQESKNIRGLDKLSNGYIDLRFAQMSDKNYSDINFSKISFEQSIFRNCIFLRCNFSSSFLSNAVFENCQIISCDFSEANLFNTNFIAGTIKDINLSYTNLYRANFSDVKIYSINDFLLYSNSDFLLKSKFTDFNVQVGLNNSLSKFKFTFLKVICFVFVFVFKDDFKNYNKFEIDGDFKSSYELFKQLNLLLRNTGNIPDAKIAQFCAMRSNLFLKSKWFRKVSQTLNLFLGYYMNPAYILGLMFLSITVFGIHYSNNPNYQYEYDNYVCASSTVKCLRVNSIQGKRLDIVEAVYFSAVTTATLGYGDLSPKISINKKNWHIWIPALQAILGAFLMSIFVVSLLRSEGFD